MKIYAAVEDPTMPLASVPEYARRVERIGFTGLLVPEAVHDGFLMSMLALEHTSALQVATSVLLAFPRSPTTTAYAAWDLQSMSGGRFGLGLGSQVRANIERRFGAPFDPPVSRMRDYVEALRAIWSCWQTGEKLAYESKTYQLDLMQPFFDPGPLEHPDIPIYLGGVGPAMLRLAGEVADGLMTHPTNTSPRYLRELVAPAIAEGAKRTERAPCPILASTFVATGADAETVEKERTRIRQFLGFLYSTPQYRRTLDLHGWGDVGTRLHQLSREGRWDAMTEAITDEIFDALVPSGTYDEIADVVTEWYGDLAVAITLRMPENAADDPALTTLVEELQS
ncbi:MAG: TIGR03617 family F420-dependent LLM class oxidoreductase [Candidatus Binatia bacterium]